MHNPYRATHQAPAQRKILNFFLCVLLVLISLYLIVYPCIVYFSLFGMEVHVSLN